MYVIFILHVYHSNFEYNILLISIPNDESYEMQAEKIQNKLVAQKI